MYSSKAERHCAKNKYKDKCSVVKCDKTGAGYSKCVENKRAENIYPDKSYTAAKAMKACGRARWAEQCQVVECGDGTFKCAVKSQVATVKGCNLSADISSVTLVLGNDATFPFAFLPGSRTSEQQREADLCVSQAIEANENWQAVLAALTDALIGEGCFLKDFVTSEVDGSCAFVADSRTDEEVAASTSCLRAVAINTADAPSVLDGATGLCHEDLR